MKFITAQAIEKSKARIPVTRIVDFINAVAWIRGIKLDLEIAAMLESAGIADAGCCGRKRSSVQGLRRLMRPQRSLRFWWTVQTVSRVRICQRFFVCASRRSATANIRWTEDVPAGLPDQPLIRQHASRPYLSLMRTSRSANLRTTYVEFTKGKSPVWEPRSRPSTPE